MKRPLPSCHGEENGDHAEQGSGLPLPTRGRNRRCSRCSTQSGYLEVARSFDVAWRLEGDCIGVESARVRAIL